MMSGVNYVIYGCSCARATPGVSLNRSLADTGEKYCCRYYSRPGDKWHFEKKIKNQTCRLFLLT